MRRTNKPGWLNNLRVLDIHCKIPKLRLIVMFAYMILPKAVYCNGLTAP